MVLFTPEEYERLCCLVYIDDLTLYRKNLPLGIIANDLLKGFSQKKPGMSAETDFRAVLRDIVTNPELARLTMTDFIDIPLGTPYSGASFTMPGFRAITFYDPINKKAAVVFRGTYGDEEWADNGRRMYTADTQSAVDSVNFVKQTSEKSGVPIEKLGVAGHSGGGNKAMYVYITDDTADECFSLDGEGFSVPFYNKYRSRIIERADDIVAFAERRDPVNGLGLMLSVPLYFSGKRGDTELPAYPFGQPLPCFHIPDALRNSENEIIDQAVQSPLSEVINKLTVYVLEKETPEKVKFICDNLVTLMMTERETDIENQAEAIYLLVEAALSLCREDPEFKNLFAELFRTEERMIQATMLAAALKPAVEERIKDKIKEKPGGLEEDFAEKCLCSETGRFSLCKFLESRAAAIV
jgi:hypothetical protein